jgi:hypothetical protein
MDVLILLAPVVACKKSQLSSKGQQVSLGGGMERWGELKRDGEAEVFLCDTNTSHVDGKEGEIAKTEQLMRYFSKDGKYL